jgi:hypothetical protein
MLSSFLNNHYRCQADGKQACVPLDALNILAIHPGSCRPIEYAKHHALRKDSLSTHYDALGLSYIPCS